MSGLVFASLAMLSVIHNEIRWMWLWLALAMIVDGVDGTCARRARVKEVIPWFDGGVLDILIDYLTWTFIPALFMYLRLPLGPKPVAGALMILVLVSSTFCYANEGEKSTDNYFVGFPAAWNIVAVMMWVLALSGWLNIALTILLSILTLVPTHYVHPARVARVPAGKIAARGVWGGGPRWLGALPPAPPLGAQPHHPTAIQPDRPIAALVMSVGGGVWLLVAGALRTARGVDTPA